MKSLAPRILLRKKADLLHSTAGFWINPPHGLKHVVTLPDMAIFRHPERFRAWQKRVCRRALVRAVRADRITTISRFTAEEGMKLLGLPASKIDVVYLGCDFHEEDLPSPGPETAFEAPGEFFLFVGSLEPGKNLALLRQVYQLAEDGGEALPPLMIVGARWAGVKGEGKPPANWRYLGRQPDSVLVHLYQRALALLFPSKYEGFGFPVVEAMALGCPVICSPVASLPEVGGDAAVYSPLEPAEYLKRMKLLIRDEPWRRELRDKGYKQARQFTWRKCAAETLEVYRRA